MLRFVPILLMGYAAQLEMGDASPDISGQHVPVGGDRRRYGFGVRYPYGGYGYVSARGKKTPYVATPTCPEVNGSVPATCCDIDGSCTDGDDDWCCDGDYYCSNDGPMYARAMGGIQCPSSPCDLKNMKTIKKRIKRVFKSLKKLSKPGFKANKANKIRTKFMGGLVDSCSECATGCYDALVEPFIMVSLTTTVEKGEAKSMELLFGYCTMCCMGLDIGEELGAEGTCRSNFQSLVPSMFEGSGSAVESGSGSGSGSGSAVQSGSGSGSGSGSAVQSGSGSGSGSGSSVESGFGSGSGDESSETAFESGSGSGSGSSSESGSGSGSGSGTMSGSGSESGSGTMSGSGSGSGSGTMSGSGSESGSGSGSGSMSCGVSPLDPTARCNKKCCQEREECLYIKNGKKRTCIARGSEDECATISKRKCKKQDGCRWSKAKGTCDSRRNPISK